MKRKKWEVGRSESKGEGKKETRKESGTQNKSPHNSPEKERGGRTYSTTKK